MRNHGTTHSVDAIILVTIGKIGIVMQVMHDINE